MRLAVRHRVLVTYVEHFTAVLNISVVAGPSAGTLEVGLDRLRKRVLGVSDHGPLVLDRLFPVDVACGLGVPDPSLDLKSDSERFSERLE